MASQYIPKLIMALLETRAAPSRNNSQFLNS